MDMYGESAHDFFHIDDLLNFSNDDIFYSSSSSAPITDSDLHHQNHLLFPPENHVGQHQSPPTYKFNDSKPISNQSNNFTDNLCVPSDDVAELEWLSMYVDDSFTDVSLNEMAETTNFRQEASFPGRARSKRSRAASTQNRWNSLYEYDNLVTGKYKQSITSSSTARKRESSSAIGEHSSPSSPGEVRKCMHCASEKTPQWRTGPLGPKTLCNACGVRYKSGRLVPEYRPAASPTFVLTQHSNSHRKVMELRRQKENLRHQEISNHQHQQHQHQHQHHNQQQLLYKVC